MTNKPKRRWWTIQDQEWLIKNYEEKPLKEMAEKLGRTVLAIKMKAQDLGLKKSNRKRFTKGQKPWNKGLKFHAGGNSKRTQFKKGCIPPNAKAPGEMWQRKDHGKLYWMIKPEGARRYRTTTGGAGSSFTARYQKAM